MFINQRRGYFLKECNSVTDFWKELSPESPLGKSKGKFIYRGQAKTEWKLVPSILRISKKLKHKDEAECEEQVNCDRQVSRELLILNYFVMQCDLIGISIINDSLEFRKKYLDFTLPNETNKYLIDPSKWPSEDLLELMALAQHSGVPTSLLDWSKRSYVAAYFAASSALKDYHKMDDGDRLAVWVLDVEKINLYRNIKLVKVPGSTSNNLAAQSGLFTSLKQSGKRGELFQPKFLEDEFQGAPDISLPLWKITLPVKHSIELLNLCKLYGVSGATLFPSYDGASRDVRDFINTSLITNTY